MAWLCSSSFFRRLTVLFVDIFNNSFADMKWGLFSTITQQFGEIDISHWVNKYNASIVCVGEIPLGKVILISTSSKSVGEKIRTEP